MQEVNPHITVDLACKESQPLSSMQEIDRLKAENRKLLERVQMLETKVQCLHQWVNVPTCVCVCLSVRCQTLGIIRSI